MAAAQSPPAIARLDLSSAHNPENQAGTLNSGRVPLSARRLSKSVLHADSSGISSSNASGIVMLTDSVGTPRAVRVVQKEESEGRNIIRVGWIWSTEGTTYQIELRHGRKSGIRKIYINKQLVERVKTLKDLFSDIGSVHEFPLEGQRVAQLHIVPRGFSGFTYQMLIDGQPIEQNWSGLATASTDVGSHLLDLPKAPGGELGLTLVNRDSRIGCAISHVVQGSVGDMAGLGVGDVVLAVDGSIYSETVAMSNAIFAASGVVSFEVAGAMPSREVRVGLLPLGCALRSTSCRVGVLITDVTAGGPAANAGLTVGDLILSVNREAVDTAEKGLHALTQKDAAPCTLLVAGALVELDKHCTC